ncbi:DnaJ C-terminal domain-containing protein [Legionella londiniensis]|uniref:DNA-binding protein DnaJ n=1 Tax=Legionella londiniensis TaxID=45068 RepID=A0A0W0VR27_9GAMM|nr:DnaJ C-terminal domain-containing protein [Legionella londiniensis]KTD22547.1 DNA-binding protein DnaJ [Legionella londiniensis]STX92478.1 DNA-binding protein DnaJ [Legionella londiniensis]
MNTKDYYKIMGISRDATDTEIKTAYRKLARKYHPDISQEPNAEEKFKELGEAYEVLKDPKKRKAYDQYIRDWDFSRKANYSSERADWGAAEEAFHFGPDFFESIFGAGFREAPTAGADYHSSILISLEDAYQGTVKQLTLPTAEGGTQTLRVKIPKGVKPGQKIRLPGQGAPGKRGGKKGDLYLTVHIEKHPLFDLKENDVYLTLPITPWEAALGATVSVPTLGGRVDLKIPKGSQGGQKLRLKKRGLPGTTPGDQYIILKIVIPQPTTDTARDLYRKMADEMPFNPREKIGI